MKEIKFADIHAHILPGVDDGAANMEETRRMLAIARDQGIDTIIATPHYGFPGLQKGRKELWEILERVQEEARHIDREFRIYLGNELYYRDSLPEELMAGQALTLAESRYVLTEYSTGVNYRTLYNGLRNLILAGYAPILAHVERYECLDRDRVKEIRELGAYIQMNSSTLLESIFQRRGMFYRKLLKNKLLHFIATDCHNVALRPPLMQQAFQMTVKLAGEAYAREVFWENQNKILENQYL